LNLTASEDDFSFHAARASSGPVCRTATSVPAAKQPLPGFQLQVQLVEIDVVQVVTSEELAVDVLADVV
jgi:hypothetical protein